MIDNLNLNIFDLADTISEMLSVPENFLKEIVDGLNARYSSAKK